MPKTAKQLLAKALAKKPPAKPRRDYAEMGRIRQTPEHMRRPAGRAKVPEGEVATAEGVKRPKPRTMPGASPPIDVPAQKPPSKPETKPAPKRGRSRFSPRQAAEEVAGAASPTTASGAGAQQAVGRLIAGRPIGLRPERRTAPAQPDDGMGGRRRGFPMEGNGTAGPGEKPRSTGGVPRVQLPEVEQPSVAPPKRRLTGKTFSVKQTSHVGMCGSENPDCDCEQKDADGVEKHRIRQPHLHWSALSPGMKRRMGRWRKKMNDLDALVEKHDSRALKDHDGFPWEQAAPKRRKSGGRRRKKLKDVAVIIDHLLARSADGDEMLQKDSKQNAAPDTKVTFPKQTPRKHERPSPSRSTPRDAVVTDVSLGTPKHGRGPEIRVNVSEDAATKPPAHADDPEYYESPSGTDRTKDSANADVATGKRPQGFYRRMATSLDALIEKSHADELDALMKRTESVEEHQSREGARPRAGPTSPMDPQHRPRAMYAAHQAARHAEETGDLLPEHAAAMASDVARGRAARGKQPADPSVLQHMPKGEPDELDIRDAEDDAQRRLAHAKRRSAEWRKRQRHMPKGEPDELDIRDAEDDAQRRLAHAKRRSAEWRKRQRHMPKAGEGGGGSEGMTPTPIVQRDDEDELDLLGPVGGKEPVYSQAARESVAEKRDVKGKPGGPELERMRVGTKEKQVSPGGVGGMKAVTTDPAARIRGEGADMHPSDEAELTRRRAMAKPAAKASEKKPKDELDEMAASQKKETRAFEREEMKKAGDKDDEREHKVEALIDGELVQKPGEGHEHDAKMEECIEKVKANTPEGRDPDEFAHRVCYASLGKSYLTLFNRSCPTCFKVARDVEDPDAYFAALRKAVETGIVEPIRVHPSDSAKFKSEVHVIAAVAGQLVKAAAANEARA